MLCAILDVQEFWQDTASLSWKLLRVWVRLALWVRTWRWWSREFTPSLCLTALLCPSSSPEFPPGLLQLHLLQKKAKPGTVGLADDWRPSEAFGLSLAAKRGWETWLTLYLLCMPLSHNINYSFCENCMLVSLVSLVSGLACFSLVAQCVSVVELLFTAQQAPQSAHTVSSHMALFDKGHKHF